MRNRESLVIVLFWIITLLVVIGAAAYALFAAVDNISKIAVAVIGAAALLVSAIVNHALAISREQEAERRKLMQQNYATLLDRVAKYVRNNRKDEDAFDSAHLFSWIVASPTVITKTIHFMDNVDDSTLRDLVNAMREDIGLPSSGLQDVQLRVMQPVAPPGSLGAIATRATP